jgi:hypothetical protein
MEGQSVPGHEARILFSPICRDVVDRVEKERTNVVMMIEFMS